ncbi:MAG: hypothetical protein JW741_04865 [Sedimentisphaerales bacterium]|nr:hypothetical protein [Sedimentisphaerales bacterium]
MKIDIKAVLFLAGVLLVASSPCAWAHTDVTAEQARDLIDSTDGLIVIDVREPSEYCDAVGHIPGAVNYPWNSGVLPARYEELPPDRPILVVCRSGARSNAAATFLDRRGFSNVYDMLGGMSAWTWETAPCKYSGGSGTADDPYQIATAADLIALGETPEDYDKHFILTADIDLDPNRPEGSGGGTGEPDDPYLIYTAEHLNALGAEPNDYAERFKLMADIDLAGYSYDRAVIAPDTNDAEPGFQGTPFRGAFEGDAYSISGLAVEGESFLGLFGRLDVSAKIRNLRVVDANIVGFGSYVGTLAGENLGGEVTRCYATGSVLGQENVGGLIGQNITGIVAQCFSRATVSGADRVGGLAGATGAGLIINSYSRGPVSGTGRGVGGLVGANYVFFVGKYVGGEIFHCYSVGPVSGTTGFHGLVGWGDLGHVVDSFWDVEASGQAMSEGGTGKTTAEMQTVDTFLEAGWGFICEAENGVWWMPEGGYPRLAWEVGEVPPCAGVVVELDEGDFDQTIATGVVLVDFYATWCSHCRVQAPIMDEVAAEVGGKAVVGKLDIDEARSVAQAYGVSAVPTLIVFRNGNVFERFLGETPAFVLSAAIQAAIDHEEAAPR